MAPVIATTANIVANRPESPGKAAVADDVAEDDAEALELLPAPLPLMTWLAIKTGVRRDCEGVVLLMVPFQHISVKHCVHAAGVVILPLSSPRWMTAQAIQVAIAVELPLEMMSRPLLSMPWTSAELYSPS